MEKAARLKFCNCHGFYCKDTVGNYFIHRFGTKLPKFLQGKLKCSIDSKTRCVIYLCMTYRMVWTEAQYRLQKSSKSASILPLPGIENDEPQQKHLVQLTHLVFERLPRPFKDLNNFFIIDAHVN